ncbi:Mor transcription activator family protein [Comamonas thiooxydans]|uniref:Mor transcription activator family protein n=1 Tax=Comamonas thiooxydans TaxID=363952 RepID=UPI0009EE7C30
MINIPKDYRWKLSQRESEIYAEFNGYNIADLARKFNMHERSMRKLLDRVRKHMAAATDRRNRDLFND